MAYSESDKWSVEEMLPHFAHNADNVQLQRIGYTVHQDAQSGGLIYDYHVTWTEKASSTYSTWKWLIREILKSQKVPLRIPVRCDGPCSGFTDLDYVEFGLCDHNICRRCYETAESADHEGIHGCCNADCLELARIEEKRKRKSAHRKAERRRARRLNSDVSYRMQYDSNEQQEFVDKLQDNRNSNEGSSDSSDSGMGNYNLHEEHNFFGRGWPSSDNKMIGF
nr:Protein R102.10 [Haemonchus contortus]